MAVHLGSLNLVVRVVKSPALSAIRILMAGGRVGAVDDRPIPFALRREQEIGNRIQRFFREIRCQCPVFYSVNQSTQTT